VERAKVSSFEEFIKWVRKYYKDRITESPISYFYNVYVKTLRYNFEMSKEKLRNKLHICAPKTFKIAMPTQNNQRQMVRTET
jgi:hypothetical protein